MSRLQEWWSQQNLSSSFSLLPCIADYRNIGGPDLLFGAEREVVAQSARHAGSHRGELLGVLHAEYRDQVDNQTCRYVDM